MGGTTMRWKRWGGLALLALLVTGGCAKKAPARADYDLEDGSRGMAFEVRAMPSGRSSAPKEEWTEGEVARRTEATVTVRAAVPDDVARKVHHQGEATIRTASSTSLFEAVEDVAEAHGGVVRTLTSDWIEVGVPVARFEDAWAAVLALGPVADHEVTSLDLTERYTDVELRLATLKRTRDRLVALLAKATTDAERLSLLAEIQRTSEQVERLESELRVVRGLAALSSITVRAAPVEAPAARVVDRAPTGLAWIDELTADRRWPSGRRVDVALPDGFVALDEKGALRATTADGAWLWQRVSANEPVGDAAFWADAVTESLATRAGTHAHVELGRWTCERFTRVDGTGARWDVCLSVVGRELEVVQVWLPSAAHVERHGAAVDVALRGGAA